MMQGLNGPWIFSFESLQELVNQRQMFDDSADRIPDVVIAEWASEVEDAIYDLVDAYNNEPFWPWYPQPCYCYPPKRRSNCHYHGECICDYELGKGRWDSGKRIWCPIHLPPPDRP